MRTHEVVVIGGGPAGAAAARLLASWGHDTVMVQRPGGPAAAFGESIPPSCRKLLAEIGVLDRIDAAGFWRSSGNTVWWDTPEPRQEWFDGERGYQVERAAFDDLLRAAAREAGAGIQQALVRDARAIDDRVVVSADDGERAARIVLDCSGRAGVVARRGWRVEVAHTPRTVALVGRWTREGGWPGVDPTHTLVESYRDGWAWSVPVDGRARYVTAMVDPQRTELARGRPALEVYRAEMQKAPHLHALAGTGALERGPWGCDASVYVSRQYAASSMLLVGDAASFVDPLSSYGIKKALASAWLAAVAVHTALRSPAMREAAFGFFAAREREMADALIARSRQYFGDAASRHEHPFWSDRAGDIDREWTSEPDVRVLREDPRVQRAFEEIKSRPSIAFARGASLRLVPTPAVRGREIVLEDRLFTDDWPGGARYLRDVDLAALLALAPAYDDVPDLFAAYNQRHPPVALPDFLGALSAMAAFGILDVVRGS